MITSKAYMLKIMKNCQYANTLTLISYYEEGDHYRRALTWFQVFCRVCDNMLKEGRMTKATHKHAQRRQNHNISGDYC